MGDIGPLETHLSVIDLSFITLDNYMFVEKLTDTLPALVSDLGGQLGLWLGMSLISIFEVIYCISAFMVSHAMCGITGQRSKLKNNATHLRKREEVHTKIMRARVAEIESCLARASMPVSRIDSPSGERLSLYPALGKDRSGNVGEKDTASRKSPMAPQLPYSTSGIMAALPNNAPVGGGPAAPAPREAKINPPVLPNACLPSTIMPTLPRYDNPLPAPDLIGPPAPPKTPQKTALPYVPPPDLPTNIGVNVQPPKRKNTFSQPTAVLGGPGPGVLAGAVPNVGKQIGLRENPQSSFAGFGTGTLGGFGGVAAGGVTALSHCPESADSGIDGERSGNVTERRVRPGKRITSYHLRYFCESMADSATRIDHPIFFDQNQEQFRTCILSFCI